MCICRTRISQKSATPKDFQNHQREEVKFQEHIMPKSFMFILLLNTFLSNFFYYFPSTNNRKGIPVHTAPIL
uniref:Uncharacterized protein n=1 Tax=Rhizophora mucronata TaxID=61149 RepID=A0A2P2NY44_RHIMU